MINLLRKGWAFVTSKARLIIEYALITTCVALAGWAAASWWTNRATVKSLTDDVTELSGRLGGVSHDLSAAVEANKDQDVAIAELRRLRDIDSQALEGLHTELAKAGSRGDDLRARVRELERTNADAKALLDTAVPPELGCLLDRAPCAGSGGNDAHSGADRQAR